MRNKLPLKPRKIECGILNLDSYRNPGTHWVAFVKHNKYVEYYDSFGNLKPPLELVKYMHNLPINYNYARHQAFGATNCGHLCLKFLRNYWKKHLYSV
ncbi:unnamed protein product [Parnassius mnemosyne]|uniref:Ubiquitin-like protease family profile domain-containing protein n=1 Tax=Parnassius mnemosyne TaxID=213953 RepID=A0AAV1LRP2_9NEOP